MIVASLSFYHFGNQGTFTPVGAQGEFHGEPPKETNFPPEFCNEICIIYNNNNNKNTFIKRIMKRPQSAVQEVLKLQKKTYNYSKQS